MKSKAIATALSLVLLAQGNALSYELHHNLEESEGSTTLRSKEESFFLHICTDGSYAGAGITNDSQVIVFSGHVQHPLPAFSDLVDENEISNCLIAFRTGMNAAQAHFAVDGKSFG